MKRHQEIVVILEKGVFLAPWDGDPGRTLKFDSAKKFKSKKQAKKALTEAKKHREFPNGELWFI